MHHTGKLATVALVVLLEAACHKTTPLPSPPQVPAPAQTPSPEGRRPHTTPTPPLQSAPETPVPAQPAQPDFRLGTTLTPQQQRENDRLIDQHIQHANQALTSIGNRQLTSEQKATVAQIRGFIEQAQQMRTTDVLRARSIAERADVLTRDLLTRLKPK